MSLGVLALMVVASLVLGILLNEKFKKTLIQAEKNRLESLTYAILSLIDVKGGNIKLDTTLLSMSADDTKIEIYNQKLLKVWPVTSNNKQLEKSNLMEVGAWDFLPQLRDRSHKFIMRFGFSWFQKEEETDNAFTLVLLDKGTFFHAEMKALKKQWIQWLAIGSVVVIVLLLLLLQWLLTPLVQLSDEVGAIESGNQLTFNKSYPLEVAPLIASIHSLLNHERGLQKRFRRTLDNLAHALKTPLAALQTLFDNHRKDQSWGKEVQDQLSAMSIMIDYQLKKASAVGHTYYVKPIKIRPIANAIVSAVSKVYVDRSIEFIVGIEPSETIKMEKGDVMEALGNLIENAAKYGTSKVGVFFENETLIIEDDGDGLDPQDAKRILKRGFRLDQQEAGSGIGLAVVNDLVAEYNGAMSFSESRWGGLRVQVSFFKGQAVKG